MNNPDIDRLPRDPVSVKRGSQAVVAAADQVLAEIVVAQGASLQNLSPVAEAFAVEMRRRWPELSDDAMARLFSDAVHASIK